MTVAAVVQLVPLGFGWILNGALDIQDDELRRKVFRYAYPGLMATVLAEYCALCLKRQVEMWRLRIRDEVYLIGERLHNYSDKGKQKADNMRAPSVGRVDVRD